MGNKGHSPSRLRRQPALNNSLRHAGGETVPPEAAEGVLPGGLSEGSKIPAGSAQRNFPVRAVTRPTPCPLP